MSEIPYLLFAMLALLAFARGRPESTGQGINVWSALGFISMMWAYHIRSFGVVLVVALLLLLVFGKQWRRVAVVARVGPGR